MTVYAKSRPKDRKPRPHQEFASKVEKVRKDFKEAITDGSTLNEKSSWMLKHAFLVAEYHLEQKQAPKDRLLLEIGRSEEVGHKLSFSAKERSALAWLVTEAKAEENLDLLHQKLAAKVPESFKEHLREVKVGKKNLQKMRRNRKSRQ